jgi:S-adenosylmethionine hydrolase
MASRPRILTLTTDFGADGPYVAAMKGIVLGQVPDARLVDVSHAIEPQNVREAAFILGSILDDFPRGTVHLAVVDPGVGTSRRALVVHAREQWFIGPDNGLIPLALGEDADFDARVLVNPAIRRPRVSATFHGRDIFAPVAAYVLKGGSTTELGPRAHDLVRLPPLRPREDGDGLVGEVLFRDRFGNLITNVPASSLVGRPLDSWSVTVGEETVQGVARTYGDHRPGTLIALAGSNGMVEVAVVQGDAAARLGAGPGAPVRLRSQAKGWLEG